MAVALPLWTLWAWLHWAVPVEPRLRLMANWLLHLAEQSLG